MRRSRIVSFGLGIWVVGSLGLLWDCVGDDSTTSDGGKNDATTDVANDVAQPPDAGFTLSLAPGHVTEDPATTSRSRST